MAALLDKPEAAAYLSIEVSHLEYLVAKRRIPFVRVGSRYIRFRREDLDGWVDATLTEAENR